MGNGGMKIACLLAIAFVASLSAAYGKTKGPTCPLPWATPWVADKEAAKAIYLAVAHSRPLFKRLLKQYPVVVVEDEGATWGVSQANNDPPKPGPNEVIVTAGGGQLYMQIDKCSGAIRNAAYNR